MATAELLDAGYLVEWADGGRERSADSAGSAYLAAGNDRLNVVTPWGSKPGATCWS